MPLINVALGILLLLILMLVLRLNAFFALLITSLLVGLFNGMSPHESLNSIIKGIGDTMGGIILILVFGAMLGKLIEESGAAHAITYRLTDIFGLKNIQYAILLTGFLVGIPMMYNASFLVLIPLIYTFASITKLPLLYLGIPLSATLSIAHGYLPPHPAPTAVALMYHANINKTLLYGLVPCVPAMMVAGIFLSKFFRKLDVQPPAELFTEKTFKREELPGFTVSVLTVLTPVFLMLAGALVLLFSTDSGRMINHFALFLSDPNVALFIAVFIGIYTLGLKRGKNMKSILSSLEKSVGSIAMIILIIAAGGAFKQVLTDSGVADYIKAFTVNLSLNPLILAWVISAMIRAAVGSATVATITAAGIMVPIVSTSGISPELLVLATGSGSLMFSHFNDIGFWMFKEYYNVTIKQTFLIWTVMESLVAVIGLICALLLNGLL